VSETPRRILVTGSAGAIGRVIAPALRARGHFVRGFDCVEHGGCDETIAGDIADAAAVDRAVGGCDTLIHLAAEPNDAPFVEKLLQPNVVGLFRVMDAARRLGVKRVVLASSMQVVSGRAVRDRPVRVEDGPAPKNHYALMKVWAEHMGEMYARRYGLEVIAARIGWFVRNSGEARRLMQSKEYSGYLSHDDAARFFAAAVEATLTEPFHVLFVLSANEGRPAADVATARRVIGYEPRDAFPNGLSFDVDLDQVNQASR
jgi:uronate dehydrogenase